MLQQQKKQLEYWKACIYEQQEDETAIISCMRRLIGDNPRRILEVGCGGAKLSAPLAEDGHDVTGIDCNGAMLYFAVKRARALPNLHLRKADALTEAWGNNYDAVILGANLLCNLITDWDYKQAQKQLIQRSAAALKPGGKLILDFDCPSTLEAYGAGSPERLIFDGTDDHGSTGRYYVCGVMCDEKTRTVRSRRRFEISPTEGVPFQMTTEHTKHFPTLAEVCTWLYRECFTIEILHGGFDGEPFDLLHRRAVIAARRD